MNSLGEISKRSILPERDLTRLGQNIDLDRPLSEYVDPDVSQHIDLEKIDEDLLYLIFHQLEKRGHVSDDIMSEINAGLFNAVLAQNRGQFNFYAGLTTPHFEHAPTVNVMESDYDQSLIYLPMQKGGFFGNQLWQVLSVVGTAFENDVTPLFPQDRFFSELPVFPKLKPFFRLAADYERPEQYPLFQDPRIEFLQQQRKRGGTEGLRPIVHTPIQDKAGLHVEGMMQSHVYFANQLSRVREFFEMDEARIQVLGIDNDVLTKLRNGKAIAVHARFGDYLTVNIISPLEPDYYMGAVESMKQSQGLDGDIEVIVFTDTPSCVKALLPNDWQVVKQNKLADFYCLQQARYLVVTNSTFSLMAGTLSSNAAEVIYPRRWFNDCAFMADENYHFPFEHFSMFDHS